MYGAQTISITKSYPMDDILSETSGLIFWDGMLWTHNDNDDSIIYKLGPNDGSISGNISLAPQINMDWEEISQDDDHIYIGDIGNNVKGNRQDLRIIRIVKSSILSDRPQMDSINFIYGDQKIMDSERPNNTDYDCEAFIVTDDAIFLFTKEWISNGTQIYKLPKTPGKYIAEFKGRYDVGGLITGAVYVKDKGIVALSGYSALLQPFIFLLYDFEDEDFFGGNKRKLNIALPFHQVEGIATEDGLLYYISNERFDATATVQQLHLLDLGPYLGEFVKKN